MRYTEELSLLDLKALSAVMGKWHKAHGNDMDRHQYQRFIMLWNRLRRVIGKKENPLPKGPP